MPSRDSSISLDDAVDLTRTGDLWLFRGSSGADQAIRVVTNSPVNHVGMAVVLDDLPPLMWHAELGKGLQDVWTGSHHRGVQLHDLREAVVQWRERFVDEVAVGPVELHPVEGGVVDGQAVVADDAAHRIALGPDDAVPSDLIPGEVPAMAGH